MALGNILACNYHSKVKSLTRSQYAGVGGDGDGIPKEHEEWVRKRSGKWNGYPPRRYKNAAFQVIAASTSFGFSPGLAQGVELINSGGRTVATIPLPPKRVRGDKPIPPQDGLLDGDLLATEVRRRKDGGLTVRRWTWTKRGGWRATGYADRDAEGIWEHGADMAEIRAERARKKRLAEIREDPVLSRRMERFARLVTRLCCGAEATVQDARDRGYCRVGIKAFQKRYGIGNRASLRDLIETGHPAAQRLALDLARKIAAGRMG